MYYSWDIARGFYPKSANELCQVAKVNDSLLGLKYQFPIEQRELKSTAQIRKENENIRNLSIEIQNSDVSAQQKEILKKQISGEIELDIEAIKGNKDSLKDEWLTFIFSIPLILAFIPGCEEIVAKGFEALDKCPTWYKAAVSAMIASVFSLRGAKAFMNRKK